MSKSTPGPWSYDPETGNVYHRSEVNDEPAIAHTTGIDPSEKEHDEAVENARLIAAAPAMLEILKSWVEYIEMAETDSYCEVCCQHAPKDTEGRIAAAVLHLPSCKKECAKRVIAKAEGGE